MLDLDTSLADITAAYPVQQVSATGLTMASPEAKVRLSHSTMQLIRGCERKFQKTKLLLNNNVREESPALSFGKAYGAAQQLYFILRTEGETPQVAMDSAIWELFLNYSPLLEDDKRFLERAVYILIYSQSFLESLLLEWEIAVFNGRYANELSFRLDINERYYYVGYLDLVLRNRRTGRYAVTDIKTTSSFAQDLAPMFRFSDQVLGYSIILDQIVGTDLSDFDCNYWVTQMASGSVAKLWDAKFHPLSFKKTLQDRFEWFLKIYMDVKRITDLEALHVYPKRDNCLAYNKPCQYYGTCQFSSMDEPAPYVEDTIDYQFVYNISDIFENHRQRLGVITHG